MIFDILQENFNFHQSIQPNVKYKLCLYSNFKIDSIYIDSITSKHFDDICKTAHFGPLVTFSFENSSNESYFVFVCQNLCSVLKVDDVDKFKVFLNSIEKTTMVASKESDLINLKKYAQTHKFSFLDEDEILDSYYNAKKLKQHYKINELTFDDNLTIGRYLFLCSLPLFSFFLRRNYFPTSAFEDQTFLFPSLFQRSQVNMQNQKKIPKFQDSDFIYLRIIGYGTCSIISLVVHKTTGFLFALKTYTCKKYYKREYKVFEKNLHSRIIRCYGVVSQGANKAFILDFMCNGNLDDRKRNDPNLKSKVIYQILFALDHFHSCGLVHCDIKLSSILLNRDFDAYLTGFSNLHDYVSIDKKTINVGTFPFMAPEIITGSDKYTFQADLYSLGVLIYEFTTGKGPYDGLTLLEAIKKGAVGGISHLQKNEGQIVKLFEQCISSNESCRSTSYILRRLFEKNHLFYADTDDEVMMKFIEKLKSEETENENFFC